MPYAPVSKEQITAEITRFVADYAQRKGVQTAWGAPLVGYADARHPYIQNLPRLVGPTHALPQDVMPDARIVICYYLPFTRALARSNATGTHIASPEWAQAYEETNALFSVLNDHLIEWLTSCGVSAAVAPQARTFDTDLLVSDWSFRHFAYAAGLGTFGLNNMLITRKGCCGRYNTLVTNLSVEPDQPLDEELCLYKKNGTCMVCVRNCPVGALDVGSYDRHRCREVLLENAAAYPEGGSTYVDESTGKGNSPGTDVCGKCVTQSPCAFLDK